MLLVKTVTQVTALLHSDWPLEPVRLLKQVGNTQSAWSERLKDGEEEGDQKENG